MKVQCIQTKCQKIIDIVRFLYQNNLLFLNFLRNPSLSFISLPSFPFIAFLKSFTMDDWKIVIRINLRCFGLSCNTKYPIASYIALAISDALAPICPERVNMQQMKYNCANHSIKTNEEGKCM